MVYTVPMSFNKLLNQRFIPLFLVLMSVFSYAHQPHVATFVFSKINNDKYIVQMDGALTGFEGEINYHYGKEAYKTPEKFRELVIDFFNKNVSFSINEKKIKFKNPMVILGHETKVVAEVTNIPKEIKSIQLKNTFFQYTPQNQMTVLWIADNFPKHKYVLNSQNDHHLNIVLKKGIWEKENSKSNWLIYLIVFFCLIIIISIAFYYYKKQKN